MRKPMSNSSFLRATPFGYGAGHVQPNRAADPGLVYDAGAADYLGFLCALGYNSSAIAVPHLSPTGAAHAVTRRVRNVGAGAAAYDVRVHEPRGVAVDVRPRRLKFAAPGKGKQFTVTFRAREGFFLPGEYVFGRLIWSDGAGRHRVKSPLVVRVVDSKKKKTPLSIA